MDEIDLFLVLTVVLSSQNEYSLFERVTIETITRSIKHIGRLNKTHSVHWRACYQVGRCNRTYQAVRLRRLFLCTYRKNNVSR
jgi:hypothetical protein